MNELIEKDQELFLFLNNLGNSNWDWFWLFITDKWAAIPLYAILLFLLYKKIGLKPTLLTMGITVLLITSTDQLANVFKHAFERPRPCGQEGVMEYARYIAVRCGRFGYFSAHASSTFGLAIYLGLILKNTLPKIIFFLLGWAAIVSYSRIYVGVHYPGDVITGMLIGIFLGWLFYKLFKYLSAKYIKE